MTATLAAASAAYAAEVQASLDGVLPGTRRIVSSPSPRADGRYVVEPEGATREQRRIPLAVAGVDLAFLDLSVDMGMDHLGRYPKTMRSEFAVYSVLDRAPLVRVDYRADMTSAPIAHWQLHAERGAFTHLLSRAHAHRPRLVDRPHDLSSLHFPVGGERFRPCLEDLLEFLVTECGVDCRDGWQDVVRAGRERWRRRQLASATRDVPDLAARVLGELGWTVTPPPEPVAAGTATMRTW